MNKKYMIFIILLALVITGIAFHQKDIVDSYQEQPKVHTHDNITIIEPTTQITKITDSLSVVKNESDYLFDEFLSQGGAESDDELLRFFTSHFLEYQDVLSIDKNPFGCSTLSVQNQKGEYLFGRNFDWNECEAMMIVNTSQNVYHSISTVNTDFINGKVGMDITKLPSSIRTILGLYTPLDGMNEKGLAVSVNMIQDQSTIHQQTSKPNLTTTTAIRLLLDQAANVDEALTLLENYDLHSSMDMMVHFAIADTHGKSVVVEYIDNEMIVTPTVVVTNFYLSEGERYGIGTKQSHERYQILMDTIHQYKTLEMKQLKDTMESVSKKNFNEYESTQWSVLFNQSTQDVYYYRENYDKGYQFLLQ